MATALDQPAAGLHRAGGRLLRRSFRWAPAATVLLATTLIFVSRDAPVVDVARYVAYAGWAVLLPGVLVYRTLRAKPHSLVDDLAMGAAVGLALEIGAWAAFTALGIQPLLLLWPLVVVVPYLAVPRLRKHWRRPSGYESPSLAWSWTVAGIVGFGIAYVVFAMMWTQGPTPAPGGTFYHLDLTFLQSLAAEAKHHVVIHVPSVASESLPYHYFAYAHQATGSWVSGVDLSVAFLRLDPPMIIAMAVVLLAVAGWRISGKPWVGALAAGLFFVVGELTLIPLSVTYLGTTFAYYSWVSPSTPYGFVFAYALMVAIVAILNRDSEERAGRRTWVLMTMLAVVAAGAKSTVIPLLLSGIALAGLVELIRRKRIGSDLLVAVGILLGAQMFAVAVVFRFETLGLDIDPLRWVRASATGPVGQQALLYAGFALTYACYMLPRLAGIPVLARLTGRDWDRREWFLLGAFSAGLLATMAFNHPGLSQNFFMSTGYAFGAVLSAMGYAALVERHRLSRRTVAVIVVGTALAAYLFVRILLAWPAPLRWVAARGLPGNTAVVSVAALMALALLAATAGWLGLRWFVRRPGGDDTHLVGLGASAALAAVLVAGISTLPRDARLMMLSPNWGYHTLILPQQVSAAHWLREHSAPDDLAASNDHCVTFAKPEDCYSLVFWINAYSERRTLVGGWENTPRIVNQMNEKGTAALPFWDDALLAENEAMFYAPTAELARRMRETHGVRWLVVNRNVRNESPELARFATLRHQDGPIAIYDLVT